MVNYGLILCIAVTLNYNVHCVFACLHVGTTSHDYHGSLRSSDIFRSRL